MKSKIALISMPWVRPDYSSIQVGRLKAFLKQNDIDCAAFYPYIQLSNLIGHELYFRIADLLHPILAEGFFANMLDTSTKTSLIKECIITGELDEHQSALLLESCSSFIINLSNLDTWKNFSHIGFSCSFNQVFASISLARLLKQKYPWQKIVLGGGNMLGDAGRRYLATYDFIDCVISGPGEEALLNYLNNDSDKREYIEGVFSSRNIAILPDYKEFFSSSPISDKMPTAILTASDGCDYGKCTFCALNERKNYHALTSYEIAAMVQSLVTQYGTRSIEFADTSLPTSIASDTFATSVEKLNLRMYGEIRAVLNNQSAANLKRAGFYGFQIGIESFNASILKRMKKPATTLDNIYNLRVLYENELEAGYNLILDYPGTTAIELDSMINLLPSIFHLAPPTALIHFQLCRGSAIYNNISEYSIDSKYPSCLYVATLSEIADKLLPFYFDYTYNGPELTEKFHCIDLLCRKWVDIYNPLMSALSYEKTDDGTLVYDSRSKHEIQYCLSSSEGKCLQECDTPVSIVKILQTFGNTVVNDLSDKKLLFQENGRVLSLPVQRKIRNLLPPQPIDSYFSDLLTTNNKA